LKSGDWCPKIVEDLLVYLDVEAGLRSIGEANAITNALSHMELDGMRTDDFMFYFADIFVESVQYGNRSKLCDFLNDNIGLSMENLFYEVLAFG